MVTKEALARRDAFLKTKEEAGGYDALVKAKATRPINFYFDIDGEIKGISHTLIVDSEWNHYQFTQEQTEIMYGKPVNLFFVRKDTQHDQLYHLELKPVEYVFKRVADLFLVEVPYEESDQYEVRIAVKEQHFEVTLHTDVLAAYNGISSENATANGKRGLRFYFTAWKDPHFMLHYLDINIEQLIKNKQVRVPLPIDLRQCSVYVSAAFTKYIRHE